MAVSLTTAEQAGVAAGDSTLDTAFSTGLQNPDTSTNTVAMRGYVGSRLFGQPATDLTPEIRGPFRSAWVALVRALSSFVEAFTEVGSGGGTPNFQNSWTNAGGGLNTCAFYKNPFGEVRLKGSVTGGTTGTVFTLPAGYRPPGKAVFIVDANSFAGFVTVDTSGNVAIVTGAGPVSLDGVSFRATQ